MARTPQTPGAPSTPPAPQTPPASLADEATKPTQPDAGGIAPVDLSGMSDDDKNAYIARLQEQLAAAQAQAVDAVLAVTPVPVPAATVVQPAPTGGKVNWRLTESGWEH